MQRLVEEYSRFQGNFHSQNSHSIKLVKIPAARKLALFHHAGDAKVWRLLEISFFQVALLSIFAILGCGSASTPTAITSVSVTCSPTSVTPGTTSQCSAVVAGSGTYSSAVTWSATNGTVSAVGVFTSTGLGSATITATSTQDRNKSGSAVINVTAPSTITGIAVSCSPTSILSTASANCTATVSGTGSYNSAVTWSATNGAITASGVFTPSAAGSATITATSIQDPSKSASAVINVTLPSTITGVVVSCSPASIPTRVSFACTAAVSGTGSYSSSVTWSASSGTITSVGVFTPKIIEDVTITATSTQDKSKFGFIVIKVVDVPTAITGVAVICSPTSILTTASAVCSVTVSGTGSYSSAVTWSATNGTVTSAGLYKPAGAGVATITATSTDDPTKSGSATVTVNLASSMSLYGVTVPVMAQRSLISLDLPSGSTTSIYTFPEENVTVTSGGALDAVGKRYFQVVGSGELTGQIYQIDIIDLTGGSSLRIIPNLPYIQNLTFNTSSGLLYGVSNPDTGPRSLVRLDPSNGSIATIYSFPEENVTVTSGGALDPAGERYFQVVSLADGTDQLDIIDLTGRSPLRIIPNLPYTQNLTFDTLSSLLYGVSDPDTGPRSLVSLDPSIGSVATIYTFADETVRTISGGALDSAGKRYFQVVSSGVAAEDPKYLLRIIDLTGMSPVQTISNLPYFNNLTF